MTAVQQQEDEMAQVVSFREARAKRIRALSQSWAENTIALGHEFKTVRDTFPLAHGGQRPGWHEWIESHTGWSAGHVRKFIRIAESAETWSISTTTLSHQVLEYLSKSDIPDSGAKEVIRRAKGGERISISKAQEIVRPHLPTRSQAIKEAQQTGRLVQARDGKLYSGASEDDIAAHSDRRSAVFGVERAIRAIADCELDPRDWVAGAEDHWLSEFDLSALDQAVRFLTKLKPLLEKRLKVISQ